MVDANEVVEIELRSCFIQVNTGEVVQVTGVADDAHLYAIYLGSPGFFEWCADFQELEYARMFANALELHMKAHGIETLNRAIHKST